MLVKIFQSTTLDELDDISYAIFGGKEYYKISTRRVLEDYNGENKERIRKEYGKNKGK